MELIMKKIILTATFSVLFLATGYVQAATEVQSFSQGMSLTDWSNDFSVNQFNSSLGTLNDVVFSFSGSSNIDAVIKNTGSKTATNVRFSGISLVDVNVGSVYSSEIDASLSNFKISNIASGATATTGMQTVTAATDTQTFTTDLSSWIGTGNIAGNYGSFTGFSVAGSNTSNAIATISNSSGASLTITYDYTATPVAPKPAIRSMTVVSAVPEADSYSMLLSGVGLLGFMVRRKKSA